jgi:hypothetical protein
MRKYRRIAEPKAARKKRAKEEQKSIVIPRNPQELIAQSYQKVLSA